MISVVLLGTGFTAPTSLHAQSGRQLTAKMQSTGTEYVALKERATELNPRQLLGPARARDGRFLPIP